MYEMNEQTAVLKGTALDISPPGPGQHDKTHIGETLGCHGREYENDCLLGDDIL
jgi:hypothetical protein